MNEIERNDYLMQYVRTNFADDKLRQTLIERICHEASTNEANADSHALFDLLTNDVSLPTAHAQTQSIETLKDVREPTRIGDIVFLPPEADLVVIGDIHSDYASVQHIIHQIQTSRAIDKGSFVVFLGDYTNNGTKSWQALTEILQFQQAYPDSVILLNGNHEFEESHETALNEYFRVHWERVTAQTLPPIIADRLPENDAHYSHMRLDLMRSFGYAEAQRLYTASAAWGMRLPYICIAGDILMSHSLGKQDGVSLTLSDLIYGKRGDDERLAQMGYETWSAQKPSTHAALVNGRIITADLLNEFSEILGVNRFIVGHTHYRSGDTIHLGDYTVTTIASSHPYSPDSGHYMHYEMMVRRAGMRGKEGLGDNDGVAGYVLVTQRDGVVNQRVYPLSAFDGTVSQVAYLRHR
ncbi:MAG: metallophosphoesterase [Chloroflexota bacterium]